MTLSPEDLEAVFQREHRFREALLEANRMSQPKTSVWSGLFPFLMKAVPADLVRTMIVDGGKAILANRRAAEEDQPIVEEAPAAPRTVPTPADGRRVSEVSGLVGTLVDEPKPAKPGE